MGSDEAVAADPRFGVMIGLSVVVGVLAAAGAVLFVNVEHALQGFLWEGLPELLGWSEPANWWVFAMLLTGAVLTWSALRLPGRGGHAPLHELSFDIGPGQILSVILAALASLSFGAVLGPEAPLIAIGTAVSIAVVRTAHPTEAQIVVAAGAMAAMGTILGNPLVTAILILEAAVLRGGTGGKVAMGTLLPAMVALGSGYLLQVGVGGWGGFDKAVLNVGALPEYGSVPVVDLLVALPLASVVAVVAVAAVWLGETYHRSPIAALPKLLIAGVVLAAGAVFVRAVTGEPVEAVLFSGQSYMAGAMAITAVGTIGLLVVVKALAYGISIGSGFRGGLIFPAVYLGVLVGTAAAQIIDTRSLAGFVAAGIAAGTASTLRLPFTSVLLATLLTIAAGPSVTAMAIVGAVVGLMARGVLDRFSPVPAEEHAESRP